MTDTSILAPAHLDPSYGSAEPDGGYPRSVRHFGGQSVITDPPTRYVAISTGNLDGAIALGVVPIASTHNDSGGFIPQYLRRTTHADPSDGIRALDEMIDIGLRTAPDVDAIRALHPTLITASYRGYGGKHPTALEACGPTVLPEGKGFNWKQDLLLLASALARTERAHALLERYTERVASVSDDYRASGSPSISVARFGPSGLETHGSWSFCGSVLSDLGARRPPEQSRHDNGTRRDPSRNLSDLDADLLFYTRVSHPESDSSWANAAGAGWNALSVVAAGRAHQADAASWHGHAGVLAAFAILDEIAEALRSK